MDYVRARNRLVDWLRRQMIGPAQEGGQLDISPLERYPVGALAPITFVDPESLDIPAPDVAQPEKPDPEAVDDPRGANRARPYYTPPSSIGFSFLVSRDAYLSITGSAVWYKRKDRDEATGEYIKPVYKRRELEVYKETVVAEDGIDEVIWNGRAGVALRVVNHDGNLLCTLALYNRKPASSGRAGRQKLDHYLFEARVSCSIVEGQLLEAPRVHASLLTEEEQEVELQYRSRKIYAVGHGCAADWSVPTNGIPEIYSEFMPAVEIPALSTNPQGGHKALDLESLATQPP